MNLDTHLERLKYLLKREQEGGRINSLDMLAESKHRRAEINHLWQELQTELQPFLQSIKKLPALPDQMQITWAQAVLAMRNLAFLEIDTTGLDPLAEIVRFTLVNAEGLVLEDVLIKPQTAQLAMEASRINGIKPAQLEEEGLNIHNAWGRIQTTLAGCYVVSWSQEWDIAQLDRAAARHTLEPLLIIGEDLRQHCTRYYDREYGLSLGDLCERVGHPLPDHPLQTALDRARGQVFVLQAIANGITDVRPLKQREESAEVQVSDIEDLDDDHPF